MWAIKEKLDTVIQATADMERVVQSLCNAGQKKILTNVGALILNGLPHPFVLEADSLPILFERLHRQPARVSDCGVGNSSCVHVKSVKVKP